MDAREAYETILSALHADPRKRIVSSLFEEANFGYFLIGFEDEGRAKSILHDRGELVLCGDLHGSQDCTTALASLATADQPTAIRALNF
ncbi:hypothetical protein OMW55_08980 [Sphingomonas sp. BN140010]|uniref:Uncharacterized protein n=1 Tax=Sphingomonas arvum TaxID=2992113 RepID=A0ABT3JGR7_9SPHN|nr:hypothetical protein [Sphingomonas sp. BN140010]MCW3797935.1 hypothetical protein [Sphingomonas sp. BN140010]